MTDKMRSIASTHPFIQYILDKFDKNIAEAFKNIPIADDLIARKKISLTQNLNLI